MFSFSVFLSFLSLKFYLENNSSQFFCCRGSKLTLREPVLSPCWMCLSFLANTQTPARADPRVFGGRWAFQLQSFSKLTLKQKPIHYSLLQGIQAFIQGIKMEPFISCSKIAKPSFDTFSSKQLSSTKILNWQALDQIGHFAWGIGNKRCRASCVLDVSSDTYDTLRIICGDEVCFHSLFF